MTTVNKKPLSTCTLKTKVAKKCHCAILNMLPTSLNNSTGVFASLKPNCGLKGAAILHNWLPSCNSILWAAGSGCPFLFCLGISKAHNYVNENTMGKIMFIFTILGGFTAYRFWGEHKILAVITIIVILYQLGSLDSNVGKPYGYKGRELAVMNYYTSIAIIILFILSFIL